MLPRVPLAYSFLDGARDGVVEARAILPLASFGDFRQEEETSYGMARDAKRPLVRVHVQGHEVYKPFGRRPRWRTCAGAYSEADGADTSVLELGASG
ncbi:MAG: hypothetical protein GVY12_13985 [Bacteroidetes bacterium]|nr:hypothetical protein [Bacteroidota bacterium]